jgi:hypothetical protein
MDIFKSFFVPKEMKRYRYMSALVAFAIFIVAVMLLRLPFQVTTKNSKNELIENNVLSVLAFDELNDPNFDFSPIKNSQYVTSEGILTANYRDTDAYRFFTAEYTKAGRIIRIHFVFDPYDDIQEKIDHLQQQYMEIYDINEDSTELVAQAYTVAVLTYVAKQDDRDLDVVAYFETKHALTAEQLTEEGSAISKFDFFNITSSNDQDDYLLVFTQTYVQFQIPLHDAEGEELLPKDTLATIAYSDYMQVNVESMTSIDDFGHQFASNVIDLYIQYSTVQQTLQAILIVIFYPALVVVILWLFFRKNGNLKTFKEYYNIAAISSIIPTLITFAVLWFVPTLVTMYGLTFSIFYIFILYRINLTPEKA